MGAKKKSQVQVLAERIVGDDTSTNKRKRKTKIKKEDTENLVPTGDKRPISSFQSGTVFRYVYAPDRLGEVIRHTNMGTTVDNYAHTEGANEIEMFVPRQTAVIASTVVVESMRERKRRNKKT